MMNKLINRLFIPLVLIVIGIAPLLAYFQTGLPHGHDAQDHVVRIANFYQALSEGVFIPRWGANLNWGFGHPVMMFLYPLTSYIASVFHFIGFSFVDSTKAVFVVAYLSSIVSMYIWLRAIWGRRAGVIGALLYGFAPYRFVDMYVRMAIGEHMAFVFPPLICYFLHKLAVGEKSPRTSVKYGIGLAVSIAFLILSHNAVALMFIPVIGLYGLFLFYHYAKRNVLFILYSFVSILFGFGLSAFFWVPAFFEGKYTLRNIITAGESLSRFVPFVSFFYSPWNYGGGETLTKEVGYIHWFGFFSSIIIFWRTKSRSVKIILLGSWILFLFSLFIMTSSSGFIWQRVMILQNFQFPWRFLTFTVFISSFIGAFAISHVLNGITRISIKNIVFSGVCLLIIFSTFRMWHPKDYQIEPESFYTRIYPGTTDTGESTPIWTTRFQEQYPKTPIEVISGVATVNPKKRTTTVHEYNVEAETRSELLENTIYFPGWEVFIDGYKTPFEFQSEIHRGIISFWVEKGDHLVRIEFGDTKLRTISNIVTVVSSVVLIMSGLYFGLLWKRKK